MQYVSPTRLLKIVSTLGDHFTHPISEAEHRSSSAVYS